MIKSVRISNFKSVVDLTIELGSFNVFIGENGCGKSNILEAIGFGAAASADKLDFEFLGSRGIRATNPEFMVSAFLNNKKKKDINIDFKEDGKDLNFMLENNPENPKRWLNKNKIEATEIIKKIVNELITNETDEKDRKFSNDFNINNEEISKLKSIFSFIESDIEKKHFLKYLPTLLDGLVNSSSLSNYIIYAPEQTSLRKFEETTQIYPLGIKGEGLFQYLKELAFDKKNKKTLSEIKETLSLLDWYEDFDLPENLLKNEFSLNVKDRFLDPSLQYFDQRSTNEGFLYLLFYATLFISKTTPTFFAVDNIDASFNPKLCMGVTKCLASLAKKHKKQVLLTTHNPAVLDGMNLKDENQRLFVVRRNDDGHTVVRRVEYNPNRKMKLSEVWTNGYIGGLPENF